MTLAVGLSSLWTPAPPRQEVPAELLFVVTGNERGFIRPCGCSKPKLGGIHRRATALELLRAKEPALGLVSAGDLIVSGEPQQQTKR